MAITKQSQLGYKGKKAVKKRANMPERDLQIVCEEYLEMLNIRYIRVPDFIYKHVFGSYNVKPYLKAMVSKYIKGQPDLTVLFRDGKYCCVELKTGHNQTTGQKQFERSVGSGNYHICRSIEEFTVLINGYLK